MASLATTGCSEKLCSREGDGIRRACTSSSPISRDYVDEKQARQEAALFLREAERTRKQIEKLEKERTLSVQCRKHGWTDVSGGLEEYERILGEERHAEMAKIKKQLEKIQNGVRKFQRLLIDVKPTPELIERLQVIMSEVEVAISALKEEQCTSFEGLLKEERICRQEIAAYGKKIENWNLAVNSEFKPPAAPTVKIKTLDRDLPAEVRAVESYLQKTGGTCGGWDQFDHQTFLRVWTKYSGQPAYRKEAKLYLPCKTLEEIQRHEEWHLELTYLQDRKREAIQRWKTSKELEHQTKIQRQEEAEQAERSKKEARNQAQQLKAEEEKRVAAQQLEEWKEAKRRKEEQEAEQQLAEEKRKSKREKEERRRQLIVKLSVEEQLRLKREEEEEWKRGRREEEEREMDERRKRAAKGIKRLSERTLPLQPAL
ncbi:uncharacterized protein ccdc112 isoform 2-T2 [Aulostomus maculatus]